MKRLLKGVLLFSGVLHSAFNPVFWASRRQVEAIQAPFNLLRLDSSAYGSSKAQLNDLRLLRSGSEVPYVLRTLSGGREERTVRPMLTDRMAVPGLGTQAVLDVGGNVPHNRVTIQTDGTNFRQQVRIETSEDRQHWGLVRRDGTIFDISTTDQHASNLSVAYPESTQRYLRVTIDGWNNPKALRSVLMTLVREIPMEREVVADQQPKATADNRTHSSVLELDLGVNRPFDRILFDVAPGSFSRAVTVSVSHDGKSWSISGFGNIERTSRKEHLFVTIPEQWARYVRATIANEDNPPLTFNRVRVEAIRRELIFPAEATGSYVLYSGNSKAEPARYDLRTILPAQVRALPAALGPIERNPDYQAPKPPVTERSPWLLPVLLIILVPALGAIAFRMLRQVNTSE